MSDHILNKIFDKMDNMSKDIETIKIEQTEIKADVKHHVKRSDMLQDLYNDIKENDIEPMKADINQAKGIFKMIGYISGLAGLITLILKLARII